jgi:1,2-diacylglycerol 3-alpha-glucosyltransferase
MNILMIGIGDDILKHPVGDEQDRHLDYARYAGGQIHTITYSPARRKLSPRSFGNQFFVYPSASWSAFTFPYDAYRQASVLCRKIPFDLIYTQDPFGTALVGKWLHKRFDIPFIIGNHADFIDNVHWIAERPIFFSILNRAAKYLLPTANAWRVVNDHQKQIYVLKLGLPAEHIYVRNTPVNMERFLAPVEQTVRVQVRNKLGIGGEAPVLLWVGRPVRFKRLPVLLQVFRSVLDEVPDAKLVLVGKRKFVQEDLAAEINRLNVGHALVWVQEGVDHAELPAYYQIANVYIQTSQYEGCCKAIVEAAMSGLPIVSTDAAAFGTRGLIRPHETGFLVPVDDTRLLAEQVLWVLRHPDQARQIGNSARQQAQVTFDREHSIRDIVNMWQDVVSSYKKE